MINRRDCLDEWLDYEHRLNEVCKDAMQTEHGWHMSYYYRQQCQRRMDDARHTWMHDACLEEKDGYYIQHPIRDPQHAHELRQAFSKALKDRRNDHLS